MDIERTWRDGDRIVLELDMRMEALYPISYGNQILMNRVIWGANYVIPTFDEEDPLAKRHIALRRGPVMLAQENRLGYSVDSPITVAVGDDGFVAVKLADEKVTPYENILEAEVPLADGSRIHVTDYASAGKTWTEESKMAVWMLTN